MKFYFFEIRYWLKQPMTWIFMGINALMIFGATSSDSIQVGGSFGNIYKNAPFVIQNYYAVMSLITLLMTTSFIAASTLRDFTNDTYQIIFSTPVKRMKYLLARFAGTITVSVIPMLGISLGIIIGCLMPWVDAEKIGPFVLEAHLSSIFFIALPNSLFTGAIIFLVASKTRNSMTSFITALVLLVLTIVAGELAGDLDKEWLSILADPYGNSTFSILTKYWTVNDKNTMLIPLGGLFMVNRLLWSIIGLVVMYYTASSFSFTDKKSKKKSKQKVEETTSDHSHQPLPKVSISFGSSAVLKMLRIETSREIKDVIKSPAFIVIMLAGLLNFVPGLFIRDGAYGLNSHPVTWFMVSMVNGSFYLFLISVITIFSGLLVWKERDAKMDEIYDATPHPTWVSYLSKFTAMASLLLFIQLVIIGLCVSAQLIRGFTDIRLDVYFGQLILVDFTGFILLIIISMLMHTFINNKFVAFFAFIAFIILNGFVWGLMDVETNMVQYGSRPSFTYSDMNGFGPFVKGIVWFRIYWYAFAVILIAKSILFWTRGKEFSFKSKMASLKEGLKGSMKPVMVIAGMIWILCGAFVFYNTKVINEIMTGDEMEELAADYEKTYKKYENAAQPRIVKVSYDIKLYPKKRDVNISAYVWVKNKSDQRIDSLHFTLPPNFDVGINLIDAKMVLEDERLNYRIYQLNRPMLPGDSIKYSFAADYITKGFENEVSFSKIVDNGSFFNNADFSPMIGYQEGFELSTKDERKDHDLDPKERMPKLERNCTSKCMNTYLDNHSDWVMVNTTISTDPDQIAVAPGSLIEEYEEEGRRYFRYKLDHTSLNFYSFISARYEVKRDKHRGIDVEVYYDKAHPYNVDKMTNSMKRSLDYYIENFGPYYHKQTRIIEFPRYATFAQAFPGTMPYSEGIGFIAQIESEDDIDMVFYVVAHEMAHQYWAHQVIGAGMQGATLLSESFSQYSALMVMEKEYGRDHMKKFLEREMNRYLRSRGSEQLKEQPLMYVENQGYIHYNKASLIMYYLREMIGEENVNTALRELIRDHGYKDAPYPTAHHAVDAFIAHTPDTLQYLITDLFKTITLFSNRATEVAAKEISGGKYEVTISYESKKYRSDSLGRETDIPINDWIEFGVYADPVESESLGKKLYSGLHKVNKESGDVTVVVNEKPFQAGIDPRNLLVDLVGDDNVKKVD